VRLMKRGLALVLLAAFTMSADEAVKATDEAMKRWEWSIAPVYRATLTDEEKIAGLSRAWSEVRYNFANFDLIPDLDWDATYVAYIPRVRAAQSTLAYYNVLAEFVAKLRDGHTGVSPPDELRDRLWAMPPIRQRLIGGRIVVVRVGPDAQKLIGVGDEILEVDAKPWQDYAASNVTPYLSASTPQDLTHRIGDRLLTGAAGSIVTLTIRDSRGALKTVQLERAPIAKRLRVVSNAFEMRMLPGNIAYVALNDFGTPEAADEYDRHYDEIAKADALILDVRNNGGGDSDVGYRVLSTLTAVTTPATRAQKMVYRPTDRARRLAQALEFEESELTPDPKKRLYTRPVAVLIGPATYSAAEDFLVAWKMMKRGSTIGSPSGGSTGQPLHLSLPGGGSMRICTKRDRFANGEEFVGVGIKPDIEVQNTFEDVRTGRDRVLEAAVAAVSRR
jgi:carboxyl-terminal processing protease